MDILKILITLSFGLSTSSAQRSSCPAALGWFPYNNDCYKLFPFPESTKSEAEQLCKNDGASLLSVNTLAEHQFINSFLINYDLKRDQWLTSGTLMDTGIRWSGDGSFLLTQELDQWLPIGAQPGALATYFYTGKEFKWLPGELSKKYRFICELKAEDVYKIVDEIRGFDYGLTVDSPAAAPRGPTFAQQPMNTVILGTRVQQVHMDCAASGNPEPSYSWWYSKQRTGPFSLMVGTDSLDPLVTPRLTFVTGRLTINSPDQNKDTGWYQCRAQNANGTIISDHAEVSFGSLGEFSNVAPAPVNAREYAGAQIECPQIDGQPAVSYTWYKNDFMSFIRPNFQKHTFISASGRLLFSELAQSDDAKYYCVASLSSIGPPGNYEGAYQTATKTSLGFKLNVLSGASNDFEPDIQNGFIGIYPNQPLRGGPVRMECFAYGTLPLTYSWSRTKDGLAMELPKGHRFDSNNRILELDSVHFEDDGMYTCSVFSQKTNIHKSAKAPLTIFAKPFFTYNLTHQHRDVGDHLTWQCEADGMPKPVYTWYKDGKVLTSDASNGVTVSANTLVVSSLSQRDSAMYQCQASNDHGVTYSSAQLRVIEVAPHFRKNPMVKSLSSALGGNVTLLCQPTAAPTPTYTWLKDGRDLSLTPGSYMEGDHYKLLQNGNLMVTLITPSDQGRYTCQVQNSLGSAEDYSDLITVASTVISNAPIDMSVEQGFSTQLVCEASAAAAMDMIYTWKFNDHIIDFVREMSVYSRGTGPQIGHLYIRAIKFIHEGEYTCVVNTAMDSVQASAYVTVLGPPSQAAGVSVRSQLRPSADVAASTATIPETSRYIVWTDGASNGAPITKYRIEFHTSFDETWRLHPDGNLIDVSDTTDDSYPGMHYALLNDLKAGAGVAFRVKAINVYGIGEPSNPTRMVQIPGAAPSQQVANVRGGGGSVGDLAILWDPLPEEDHNGAGLNLRYHVFWRPHDPNPQSSIREDNWRDAEIAHDKACMMEPDYRKERVFLCKYVELVGPELFYMPYDVRVQAVNDKGAGPSTDQVMIMSAEELPLGAPLEAQAKAFNATALKVTWKKVPNDRPSARGKLLGYKINYWRGKGEKDPNAELESDALQNIIQLPPGEDNLEEGLIIGLNATLWYTFNVQAYNSAGNGPKSSDSWQQTFNKVPENYPTEVHVYSVNGAGVRVTFRGISTQFREEPLKGYKVQVWESQENILSAREIDFGKMTTGVVRNLTDSKIYNLRIYGYSRAGQGKRSSPTVYFTVGEGQITINSETMELRNSGFSVAASFFSVALSLIVICFQNHEFR